MPVSNQQLAKLFEDLNGEIDNILSEHPLGLKLKPFISSFKDELSRKKYDPIRCEVEAHIDRIMEKNPIRPTDRFVCRLKQRLSYDAYNARRGRYPGHP